jgi:ethanolamine utilization protein EutA (predicted chaperonin)
LPHDWAAGGDSDHEHEDESPDPSRDAEIDDVIWRTDNVVLTTVGIDVGSATSHLMFSRLHLRRQGDSYSSRFRVVSRKVLHRSAIRLTPYRQDGSIDAEELERFVEETYRAAGLARAQVDAGAVILTGVAMERRNARAIAELFAAEGGRFVCATAGHNLEAVLAAHGSGAVSRSTELGTVLNVDVGGGTTKLAWCADGQIAATMAVSGGARLLAFDEQSRVVRLEPELLPVASDLGIDLSIGAPISEADLSRLADALASRIAQAIDGTIDPEVVLAGKHPGGPRPEHVVLSGGVAELIGSSAPVTFDDLGPRLAISLEQRLRADGIPLQPSHERIRATVIGASQFAVQLSGNTVHVSESARLLPVHGLPVVSVVIPEDPFPTASAIAAAIDRGARLHDLDERTDPVAIAIRWDGEPRYERLRAIAEALASTHRAAARRHAPLVVALQADVAASLGSILTSELGIDSGVVAIDGLELNELDYIDIGEQIMPAGTLPVVIKSLVFAQPADAAPSTVGTGGR